MVMFQTTSALALTRFGTGHIRIKPVFTPEEERAMTILSAELKARLESIDPSPGPLRLEQVSQWGTRVLGTLVNLNNRLRSENSFQVFIRHIEEWFADYLGIPIKDHSLSPQENQFLALIPKLTVQPDPATGKEALQTLLDLYAAEHEGESV